MDFLFAALALGFLGSFHCIGMCGPIALALPIGQRSTLGKAAGILTYNIGRIITYSLMGLLFGLIGRGFSMVGLQQILSVALGAFIIIMVLLPGRITSRLDAATNRIPYISFAKQKISSLFRQKTFSSLFTIGILNGLLPCGFVYMGLAGAIASGTAIDGALFMMAFGLGTLPAMFIVAFSSRFISLGLRSKMRKAVPVFMLLVGTTLVLRGMNLGVPYLSPKFDDKGHIKRSCCQRQEQKP